MNFKGVIKGVMSLGNYTMLRNSGSTAIELEYFQDHKELENQYLAKISPEQLGRDIIDAATSKALGQIQ